MDIRITAIHFDISDKLKEFITKKAQRVARRYVDIMNFDVSLRVVKPETAMNKEAVVMVVVPGAEDMVGTKTADSFEEAVDLAIEAVERQLEKLKGRREA